jgi:predicted PurR-regulated permease PerM
MIEGPAAAASESPSATTPLPASASPLLPLPPRPQVLEIRIPVATLAKVIAACVAVWVTIRLGPEIILVAFAILFAVALAPTIDKLEARRVPRWVAVFGLAIGVLGVVVGFFSFVVPSLVTQMDRLFGDLPGVHDRVIARLPRSAVLHTVVEQAFAAPRSPELLGSLRPLAVGQTALSGAVTGVLLVVLTLYLVLEGKRLYAWILAYVPRAHRARIAETVPGVTSMIQAFVRGQLLISGLFAIFVGGTISALGLQAALPLAILAFVCDVIPVVGIIIATVPAAMLALADSPLKAAIVVALFMGYHMFETYVLVPRIYGSAMRLSTLAVLLALLVGASLQGVLGAILVLPVIAAYPIIERIWLKRYLSADVLLDHQALDRDDASGSGDAVDKIIRGQRHSDEGELALRGPPTRR